jgi:hypothetical protein
LQIADAFQKIQDTWSAQTVKNLVAAFFATNNTRLFELPQMTGNGRHIGTNLLGQGAYGPLALRQFHDQNDTSGMGQGFKKVGTEFHLGFGFRQNIKPFLIVYLHNKTNTWVLVKLVF